MVVWIVLLIVSAGVAAVAQSAGMGAAADALFVLAAIAVVIALVGYCHLDAAPAFPGLPRLRGGEDERRLPRSSAVFRSVGEPGAASSSSICWGGAQLPATLAITIPAIIVIALVPGANTPQYAQTAGTVMLIIIYGSAFAIQALTKPVYGIALMLFYYDQRIRHEGFDIELLMQRAGLIAPPPPPPSTETWPPSILPRAQAAAAVLPKPAMLQQPAVPTHAKSEESL